MNKKMLKLGTRFQVLGPNIITVKTTFFKNNDTQNHLHP